MVPAKIWRSIGAALSILLLCSPATPVTAQIITLPVFNKKDLQGLRGRIQCCLTGQAQSSHEGLAVGNGYPCLCQEDVHPQASSALERCTSSNLGTSRAKSGYEATMSVCDLSCSATVSTVGTPERTGEIDAVKRRKRVAQLTNSSPTAEVAGERGTGPPPVPYSPTGVLETSVLPVSAITAPPPSFSDVASPSATPNAASTATKENDKANGGLTKSDKIQIIVGTVVPIFCLIMSGIFLCLRKRGAKAKTVEDSEL